MLISLQFLTIFPIKFNKILHNKDFSKAMAFFPVIGLIIGLILACSNIFLSYIFSAKLVNIFIVILLIVLTGGLHSDGLADTVDGLYGGKTKGQRLEIMKDSRIGTMGALSLICIVFLKIYFLETFLGTTKLYALICMPVLSRWSMLLPMKFFPYARPEGKAKIFFESINMKVFVIATIIMLVLIVSLLNLKGTYIVLVISAVTILLAGLISSKLGGITGDVLGLVNEVNEILFLILFYLLK